MNQVDSYLFKLSFATIGQILRGSEYEEAQDMDKGKNMAKTEPEANGQTKAHND
jgi:hypothetical protein